MWSSTFESSAAIRSTSASVELEPRQAGDVENLSAIEHATSF